MNSNYIRGHFALKPFTVCLRICLLFVERSWLKWLDHPSRAGPWRSVCSQQTCRPIYTNPTRWLLSSVNVKLPPPNTHRPCSFTSITLGLTQWFSDNPVTLALNSSTRMLACMHTYISLHSTYMYVCIQITCVRHASRPYIHTNVTVITEAKKQGGISGKCF